jgi:hypothetical protein
VAHQSFEQTIMSFRYKLSWNNSDGQIWHDPISHSCVADARTYAIENSPAGATHYRISNISWGGHTVEGKLAVVHEQGTGVT